jgi:8-oxo-dGTP diphosphatase
MGINLPTTGVVLAFVSGRRITVGTMTTTEDNTAVAIDLVVLTVLEDRLVALLAVRDVAPFRNRLALPGVILLDDEDLPEAAERTLWEQTPLDPARVHLEQLATYGAPDRDPRVRTVTVAYLALVPGLLAELTAATGSQPGPDEGEAQEAEWVPVDELVDRPTRLAFDHHRILTDGLDRVRAKLEYSPLGTAFCPDEFTIGDLRRVYAAVWGIAIDPRNFHRKVSGTADFVVETGRVTSGEGGRPARLYRRGKVAVLHPPMSRPT